MYEPLTENLERFLDDLTRFSNDLSAKFDEALDRQQQTISCRSCPNTEPGCCFMKVAVPFFEAIPIARHLKQNGLDTPELRKQLLVEGEEMEGTHRTEWFKSRRPCVFLKEGRCSIYQVRPTACRMYVVITDPARCQPESDNNEVGFVDSNNVDAMMMKRQLQIHRMLHLKENKYRLLIGALPRVVLIALEAWDSNNYIDHIGHQPWPTADNVGSSWLEGRNVFGEKLLQIRRSRDAP